MSYGYRVRVKSTQFQTVPLMSVAVNWRGSMSVTVTVPLVLPAGCVADGQGVSRADLPLSEIAGVALGNSQVGRWENGRDIGGDVVDVLVSPPPETLAVFVMEEPALPETLTVTVMAG